MMSDDKSISLVDRIIEARGRRQTVGQQANSYFTLEPRPLLMLFATGQLEGVDAVSVGTLSDQLLTKSRERREGGSLAGLDHDLPIFSAVRTLTFGRIASFTLPRFYTQIYADRRGIVNLIYRTRKVARLLGAQYVSLTGLLASVTEYGNQCSTDPELPPVTTGHATTASAVVLNIRDMLTVTGRNLSREAVGFIGLGSVGSSTATLMINVLEHPKSLCLCDVYQKRDEVATLMTTIRSQGFTGPLDYYQSRGPVPESFYDCTLIVGATNVPNIIDMSRLKPGTLMIDDSDPHCFSVSEAFRRLEERGDILFTEGGALRSTEIIEQLHFVPEDLMDVIPPPTDIESGRTITGCVLSPLLSARFGYPATRGWVKPEDAMTHYRGLVKAGFSAPQLHCGSQVLPASIVNSFRERFGKAEII